MFQGSITVEYSVTITYPDEQRQETLIFDSWDAAVAAEAALIAIAAGD